MNDENNIHELLLAAVRAGDVRRVAELVEGEGADWERNDQEALYIAAQENIRPVVSWFLKQKILPVAREETRRIYRSSDHLSPDDVIDRVVENMLEGDLRRHEASIDNAVAAMGHGPLLLAAVNYRASGLFRFLMDMKPDETLRMGVLVCQKTSDAGFVRPLIAAGADPSFAAGDILNTAVRCGDIETVRFLLEKGVDPNILPLGSSPSGGRHALVDAAYLSDRDMMREMVTLLLRHGADIRLEKGRFIADLVANGQDIVFDMMKAVEKDSELPLLIGLAREARFRLPPESLLSLRYPYITKWHARGMIEPVFKLNAIETAWFENLRDNDLNEDDGFMLKLAVVSDHADILLPFMLGCGANPNTQRDRPLKLAVLLEKHALIGVLCDFGQADIFANKAEVFALAAGIGNVALAEALQKARDVHAKTQKKVFLERYPDADGMTLAELRAVKDGQSGLMLAARAGMFAPLLEKGILHAVAAEDLLRVEKNGATVLSVLCVRHEHRLIFSPKLWGTDILAPEKIWQGLSPQEQDLCREGWQELQRRHAVHTAQLQLKEKARKLPRPKP